MSTGIYIWSDPRDHTIIYVGMTTKGARRSHEFFSGRAKALTDWLTAERIVPAVRWIACKSVESAYRGERRLIELYGRRCDGSGTLWNLRKGGSPEADPDRRRRRRERGPEGLISW